MIDPPSVLPSYPQAECPEQELLLRVPVEVLTVSSNALVIIEQRVNSISVFAFTAGLKSLSPAATGKQQSLVIAIVTQWSPRTSSFEAPDHRSFATNFDLCCSKSPVTIIALVLESSCS